jgi:hypothetical protein
MTTATFIELILPAHKLIFFQQIRIASEFLSVANIGTDVALEQREAMFEGKGSNGIANGGTGKLFTYEYHIQSL